MEDSTSKEKVLKKIRRALINKSTEAIANVDFESPIYAANTDGLEINFAQNFRPIIFFGQISKVIDALAVI